jgi:hypothetical protein
MMFRDERTNAPAINRLPMAASAKFCLMLLSICGECFGLFDGTNVSERFALKSHVSNKSAFFQKKFPDPFAYKERARGTYKGEKQLAKFFPLCSSH